MSFSQKAFTKHLLEGVQELHLTLNDHQIEQVFFYLHELQKWNRRINLVSDADNLVVIQHHFLDSLSCALASVIQPQSRLLDIGTGAGFPGIPLKIYYPDLQVTAIDAVTKKIMFLRHLCRSLALQHIECQAIRLEPAPPALTKRSDRELFEVIVSRAVGTLPFLISLAHPFLAPGGCLLFQRGKEGKQEFEDGKAFYREYGLYPLELREIRFSFFTYPRYLLILQKADEEAFNKNKA